MGHRAKHRHAALLRRVAKGITIKSDLTIFGGPNAAYEATKAELAPKDKAKGAMRRFRGASASA